MLNNLYKSSQNQITEQKLFVVTDVLPHENDINLIESPKPKTVIFIPKSQPKNFTNLPVKCFELVRGSYKHDEKAVHFLSSVTNKFSKQIELYAYYMWGGLDDISNINVLENKLDSKKVKNISSLIWNKNIKSINGHLLTELDLVITYFFYKDFQDINISHLLGISPSLLDKEKRKLFSKVGVDSKNDYILLATQQKVMDNEV